jgi:hypothetical protein
MVQSVIIKNDPAKAAVTRAGQCLRSAGVAKFCKVPLLGGRGGGA